MSRATLSKSVLAGAPGRDVGCDVHLTNTTAEVLAADVEVEGPAAEWAVVLPPVLALAPGESGRARVVFTVPDCERLAGSSQQFAVRVTGPSPVELAGRIEIAEVCDLRLSIHPSLARGRGATTHTVTVENRGTRTGRATLLPRDDRGNLELHLEHARVTVAPGEQVNVDLRVAPRRRFVTGPPRPHVFTVEARPDTGPPVIVEGTRFADPVRGRRGAFATALAVLIALAGASFLRPDPRSPDSPPAGMATAPATPLALTSACPARGSAQPAGLDLAGFAYCPATLTVALGAEVVWTNADVAPHTVTYDGPEGPVDSGSMAQGQSWSRRFDHAGTYRYYCRFHPGMAGTIVVGSSR